MSMASTAAASPTPTAGALGTLVNTRLVALHLAAGMFYLTFAMFGGLAYATQLINHYILPNVEVLSPGRVRLLHTNLIAFGFLFNAFLGMLYWCVPRLTGRTVAANWLGWAIFGAWQLIVMLMWIGLHLGHAQGVEWGETPHAFPFKWLSVDMLVVVGAVLVAIQFYTPIVRSKEKAMYVSLWYFSAAFVWTGLTYIMGNFFPQYLVPGAGAAAMLGLYIHDLVGLFVTPMGWGMMYFFVPVILRKPVWSHALSIVGFWGLAFFYPLQGVHHFLWSPLPMYAQYGAVVSTIGVEIVVFTVIINFHMTLRGREESLRDNIAIRWFFVGAFNYFVTCLQCAFQVTLTFQQIIHFTDWVVGHAHLVMFGVFSFWIYGMIVHLWPKLMGREWWSPKLNSWSFWLSLIGLELMFIDLTCAGLVQGFLWNALAPWEDSLVASRPFWLFRAILGVPILVAQLMMVLNMTMTWLAARAHRGQAHTDTDYTPYETAEEALTHGTV